MPEYKTHSFNKDWHDKVEKFLEENDDLAFDSPKYFIKYCVNKFMEEKQAAENDKIAEFVHKLVENPDLSPNDIIDSINNE